MLRQVAEGVLIHESEFCQSNAVVVNGPAGVLLIAPGAQDHEVACLATNLRELGKACPPRRRLYRGMARADQVRARIELDGAYVHALRDAGVPGDPRISPSAKDGWGGMAGVHELQLQRFARGR